MKRKEREWARDFKSSLKRPLKERCSYSFIKTYKPVMDDIDSRVGYRAFGTTKEYRKWCEENLPDWLGYRRGR